MARVQHPDFIAPVQVGQEIARLNAEAEDKPLAVEFGMEKVTAEQLRQRLMNNKSLREEMLKEPGGMEKILKLFGKGKK